MMMVSGLKCPEPGCDGYLVLKPSKYGQFYGCENWSKTGCSGAHGAHPDGTPLGIPASRETKQARIRAHEEFDRLWQQKRSRIGRRGAYAWLREAMHLTEEEAHIGRFTIEQCNELCRLLADREKGQAPDWRSAAQDAFDTVVMSKATGIERATSWLAIVMGVRLARADIALFNQSQCQQVVAHVRRRGPGTAFWRAWKTGATELPRKVRQVPKPHPKRRGNRGPKPESKIPEAPGEVKGMKCAEPGCEGTLLLKWKWGSGGYECSRKPDCPAYLAALEDGAPWGEPHPVEVGHWRVVIRSELALAFDRRNLSQKAWLMYFLNIPEDRAFIEALTSDQCREAMKRIRDSGPGTTAWKLWCGSQGVLQPSAEATPETIEDAVLVEDFRVPPVREIGRRTPPQPKRSEGAMRALSDLKALLPKIRGRG